jgi:hypothetical protein
MMNAHPDLYVFRETHWLPSLYEAFGGDIVPLEAILQFVRRTRHVRGDLTTAFDEEAFQRRADVRCHMALDYEAPEGGVARRPLSQFADIWYYRVKRARDEARFLKPGSYLEVRHEDVLASTESCWRSWGTLWRDRRILRHEAPF